MVNSATRLEDGRIVCTLENGVFQLIGSTWVECISGFTVRDECEGRVLSRETLENMGAFPLPDGTTAEEYR